MLYENNKEGRTIAMIQIAKLVEDGYTRTDFAGDKVVLSKTKQGKICSTTHTVTIKHLIETKQIRISETESVNGVHKAKRTLYGFASPSVECANAVRAGLFDDIDYEIMRRQYDSNEWCNAGN